MTTSAYHGYAGEMIGHSEVQHQTVQETINILTANRTAAAQLHANRVTYSHIPEAARDFIYQMNTAERW